MSKSKKVRQILSVLLCAAMMLSFASVAFAAGEENINVEFAYYNGEFVIADMQLDVYDGLAEEFGFEAAAQDHNGNTIDYITTLDVLVAAHKEYYGDKFTKDTAADYITASYGFVSKIFGESNNISFAVNDTQPNDGIYTEKYGSYTGYSADTAPVADGDFVMFYTLKDEYWSDYNTLFDTRSYEADAGYSFTVTVTGICLGWYGCSTDDVKKENTFPMEGVKVQLTQDFKTYEELGTLDKNGKLEVTIDSDDTFYLVTSGTYTDKCGEEVPIIGNYAKVHVGNGEPIQRPNLWIPKHISFDFIPVETYTDGTERYNLFEITVTVFDLLHPGYGYESDHGFVFELHNEFLIKLAKAFVKVFGE